VPNRSAAPWILERIEAAQRPTSAESALQFMWTSDAFTRMTKCAWRVSQEWRNRFIGMGKGREHPISEAFK